MHLVANFVVLSSIEDWFPREDFILLDFTVFVR